MTSVGTKRIRMEQWTLRRILMPFTFRTDDLELWTVYFHSSDGGRRRRRRELCSQVLTEWSWWEQLWMRGEIVTCISESTVKSDWAEWCDIITEDNVAYKRHFWTGVREIIRLSLWFGQVCCVCNNYHPVLIIGEQDYRYLPHNNISFNDGLHIRRWSQKIIM
jgi:hypothetical protein